MENWYVLATENSDQGNSSLLALKIQLLQTPISVTESQESVQIEEKKYTQALILELHPDLVLTIKAIVNEYHNLILVKQADKNERDSK